MLDRRLTLIAKQGITVLNRLAALRGLLNQMEIDAGFASLSPNQRDMMYAAYAVSDPDGVARIQDLLAHPLLQDMTRPTFFRTLSALDQQDLLKRTGSERSGRYKLAESLSS